MNGKVMNFTMILAACLVTLSSSCSPNKTGDPAEGGDSPNMRDEQKAPEETNAIFRGNIQRTGVYRSEPVTEFRRVKWEFNEFDMALRSAHTTNTPIVHGEHVYYLVGDGFLYALDREKGFKKWEQIVGTSGCGTPAIEGDTLFVACEPVGMLALDASTGKEQWTFSIEGGSVSSPLTVSGMVLFGGNDGNFYALNAEKGEVQWTFPVGGEVRSSPAAEGDVVYLGTARGRLYYGRQGNEDANTLLGLDIKTGSIVWEIPVEGNILSNPIIDSGIIYYLAQDKIAAVEISTKEKLWTASLGPRQHRNVSSQRIAPAVSDGTLYLPRTEPAQVVALDSRTGREKWTFDHFGDYSHPNSGISVAGEVVYFQENDTLFGLNASDGTELWRCPEGRREPGSSPALIGETVYVVNADNFLVAIQ